MAYPELVFYETEEEYRAHFEKQYCTRPLLTFDQIKVRFRKRQFKHCFFESTRRDKTKDQFSKNRAERIDWIKAALEDPESERYVGWDKKRKRYDKKRRVTIVQGNYVVVLQMINGNNANFVTAYVADTPATERRESTLDKIRSGPKWK